MIKELADIRAQIDSIDKQLLLLLRKRLECGVQARRKKEHTEDPEREASMISAASRQMEGLLTPELINAFYATVFKESKSLQDKGLKLVGFQGEHGAYSEVAAQKIAPESFTLPHSSFAEVFDGISAGLIDLGVVPVENSLGGAVSQVDDLLLTTEHYIIGEIVLPIHHSLLAPQGTDYRDIKIAFSHPQALAQCRGFLQRNKIEGKPVYDTAGSALILMKEKPVASACIANPACARVYGLDILKENIEDDASNETRFLLISREPSSEDPSKATVRFTTQHKPGALFEVLKLFSDNDINLTRIESKPSPKFRGRFSFLADFTLPQEKDKTDNLIETLSKITDDCRVLGFYKRIEA